MRRLLPLLLLLSAGLFACAAQPTPAQTLNVFAAASLTDAFQALGAAFQTQHPEVQISFNFAGSQQLATQIDQGAPADVFASANRRQLESTFASGRIVAEDAQTFARNRLVLITPADNPAQLSQLADLARPKLKLVLADPAVPVGQYTLDMLAKASALPSYGSAFSATVQANVVSYEENVRSVLAKIVLGEGDAGVVYSSDVALDSANVQQIAIPDQLNTIASYPIAPLRDSPNLAVAREFVAFVLAPEGQAILARYGFLPLHVAATGQ